MKSTLPFKKIQRVCLRLGTAGLVISLAYFFFDRKTLAHAYLVSFLYWTEILLGSMAVIMIHNITGGRWGKPIRPILETATRCIPWLLLFFLPIVFMLKDLYVWLDPHVLMHDELIKEKQLYLNMPFFTFRTAFYFIVWSALAFVVTKDFRLHEAVAERRRQASGLGLVILAFTVTFSSLDWAMSLEPHWNSTIYGFILLVGMTLSGFAFSVLLAGLFSQADPQKYTLAPERSHDLGTLLFVFVMLWAYVSLSQFLIIWSGNIPELVPWYIERLHGGWQVVAIALVLFHFAVPFFLLLMRPIKKNPRTLLAIAGLLLGMRWVDLFWYIKPVMSKTFSLHPADAASLFAIGGFILFLVFKRLEKIDDDF